MIRRGVRSASIEILFIIYSIDQIEIGRSHRRHGLLNIGKNGIDVDEKKNNNNNDDDDDDDDDDDHHHNNHNNHSDG